jgi:hypothetical protein
MGGVGQPDRKRVGPHHPQWAGSSANASKR